MRKAIGFALVLLVLAACSSSAGHSKIWRLSGVRSYTWTIEESGMAGSDYYTVRVVDGKPDASPEWRPFGIKHPTIRPLTVEDMFDVIDNPPSLSDVQVDVTYDGSLGYPRQINFNSHTPDVSDDEWSYTVTKFEVNN